MVYSKGCAYDFTSAEVLQLRRVYLAMAAQADALHGEVLAALDASGLAGETIVRARAQPTRPSERAPHTHIRMHAGGLAPLAQRCHP